jgi:hypothetical protein
MMKRWLGSVAAMLLLAAMVHPAQARGSGHRTGVPAKTASMTFRIDLGARPAQGTTFWVAYGPLDGHFGLIRLHRLGPTEYGAVAELPRDGHTDFAYVAGNGTIKTRAGLAPGDPVVTIQVFHRVTPGQKKLPSVWWQPPLG